MMQTSLLAVLRELEYEEKCRSSGSWNVALLERIICKVGLAFRLCGIL